MHKKHKDALCFALLCVYVFARVLHMIYVVLSTRE